MGTSPWSGQSYVLDDLDSPAVYVSWNDAQAYVAALNTHTGMTFRLPSEAEWEYAARAGTTTRFYWGNDPEWTQIIDYAWNSANTVFAGQEYAHVVGQLLPNGWGLYDMIGNVSEWCEDDWHNTYTGAPTDGQPWNDSPRGSVRVTRGGNWGQTNNLCRAAARLSQEPSNSGVLFGFRIVR
jgi:formylglycine-generating enzyme required for sulfatase activity